MLIIELLRDILFYIEQMNLKNQFSLYHINTNQFFNLTKLFASNFFI